MKKNTIITMCIAIGVVGIGVVGLVAGMNLDQTKQTKDVEQVPITSTVSMAEEESIEANGQTMVTEDQTKELDGTTATEEVQGDQDALEEDKFIYLDGVKIPIDFDSSVDTSKLEIKMKEAARIGLNYIKSIYSEEFSACNVSLEAVSLSGIKSGSIAWSEVIEVEGDRRYELSVDAQTGEVLDASSYCRLEADSKEWVKSEGDGTNRSVKIEKLDIEAFATIDVNMTYSADVEIVKGDKYGIIMNYYTENYKMEYENKDGILKVSDNEPKMVQTQTISIMQPRNYVTIIVPSNAKLSSITINTTSGDIAVKDINADSITTLAYSGDCTFSSINIGEIKSEAYSGEIDIKNATYDSISLKTLSGDIILQGNVYGNTTCDAVSGDIEIVCKSKENQYSYDLSSIVGDIQIGDKVKDDKVNASIKSSQVKSNHIKATTTSGDINLKFGE